MNTSVDQKIIVRSSLFENRSLFKFSFKFDFINNNEREYKTRRLDYYE